MFSALFSFLGGSVFRMIWGEISHFITQYQAHHQEIQRMELQGRLEAEHHARNLESIRLQNDLGIKIIQVQSEQEVTKLESEAWNTLVESTTRVTGIRSIDTWNQAIRPLLATLAIAFVIFEIVQNGFILNDWDKELFGAILGIYVADRSLTKRGK